MVKHDAIMLKLFLYFKIKAIKYILGAYFKYSPVKMFTITYLHLALDIP